MTATSTVCSASNTAVHSKILIRLVILLSNEKQRHDAEELVHRMVKRAVELEGTVTVSAFYNVCRNEFD